MNKLQKAVAITGVGWEIPGLTIERIQEADPARIDATCFDAAARLGRKGLRYKDHATLLALAASKDALLDAGLPIVADEQANKPTFGAVVSSNLGNLDTVTGVSAFIRGSHVNETSAMDLPNTSSNVVASGLAIRYGLQGINLMLCNGATSGIDALHLAADCIRAGRATRMIVVGVEVDTQAARDLLGPLEHPLFNGALAVVLESEESARHRRIAVRGYLGPHMPHSCDGEVTVIKAGDCDCLLAPSALAARVDWPGPCIDITAYVGESYGAEGVIQLAVTLDELAARGYQRAVMLSGGKFGDASIARIEVKESL